MSIELHTLTKSELVARLSDTDLVVRNHAQKVAKLQQKVARQEHTERMLREQIAQLQRMVFGQKRERFEGNPNQTSLPFEATESQQEQQEIRHQETVTYVRKKQARPNHKGRLPLPDHLPVEKIEIHPEGDLSEMVCIGKEVTEELELQPARFYIKRYIRYKYARKQAGGVVIGPLPERVIDKGIPGPALLATILIDKYMDHLPLYRQRQRFLRENIPVAGSTLDGWAARGMDQLTVLYEQLVTDTKTQGYLQADETPIKVLDSQKKGACHQGYYWVYHNPINQTTLFDYQSTRGAPGPRQILEGFKGYLQTDGYGVYEKIGAREGVTHLGCWAHARREFERALDNDRARAEHALSYIQQLYAIERQARQKQLDPAQCKELRLAESLPVINVFGKWIHTEAKKVLPKSQIGKAMRYSMVRWDALSAYLGDGNLQIDNNLVENAIRPVAIGRKNYLFAGSHNAAQRAAMMYSFFALCKHHQANPFEWLRHTLQNIMTTKYNDLRNLYPQNFKTKT